MPTLGTSGIILKRRNFAEADRILTIFTSRLGKVVVKGRALRKPLSKLAGHLELFTHVSLSLVEGKTWYTVAEAVTLDSYSKIRQDITLMTKAHYLCELVDHLTREHEVLPGVYKLLNESLELLNQEKTKLLLPAFTWALLAQIGYEAQLYHCVECREKLMPDNLYFSVTLGGILCSNHRQNDPGASLISSETIKLLRVTSSDLNLLAKINLNPDISLQYKNITESFSQHILDKQLKSLKFLKDIDAHQD